VFTCTGRRIVIVQVAIASGSPVFTLHSQPWYTTMTILSNNLHTPRNLGTACSTVATEFCKLRVLGSSPIGSNKNCDVAQSVERSAVNRVVVGSMPTVTVVGMKRIGKRLVLKTSARKGSRFESIACPPFRQRNYSLFLLGNSITVVQLALNQSRVGSTPTSPLSCQSSSSLGPRPVKPKTRARIPFGTICTTGYGNQGASKALGRGSIPRLCVRSCSLEVLDASLSRKRAPVQIRSGSL
jgi:hypothetical protein